MYLTALAQFDITGPHSLAKSALPHAPCAPSVRRRK